MCTSTTTRLKRNNIVYELTPTVGRLLGARVGCNNDEVVKEVTCA